MVGQMRPIVQNDLATTLSLPMRHSRLRSGMLAAKIFTPAEASTAKARSMRVR